VVTDQLLEGTCKGVGRYDTGLVMQPLRFPVTYHWVRKGDALTVDCPLLDAGGYCNAVTSHRKLSRAECPYGKTD
jgi:hypothetical protein